MANLVKTFTIPSLLVPELIEVFGQNYEATITQDTVDANGSTVSETVPNPQTKPQFASAKFDEEVKQYIRRRVVEYRKAKTREVVSEDFTI